MSSTSHSGLNRNFLWGHKRGSFLMLSGGTLVFGCLRKEQTRTMTFITVETHASFNSSSSTQRQGKTDSCLPNELLPLLNKTFRNSAGYQWILAKQHKTIIFLCQQKLKGHCHGSFAIFRAYNWLKNETWFLIAKDSTFLIKPKTQPYGNSFNKVIRPTGIPYDTM